MWMLFCSPCFEPEPDRPHKQAHITASFPSTALLWHLPYARAVADKETKALEIMCDGYKPLGNPNAYQVKAKAGQRCVTLPRTGGPDVFFTEAQNGCTVVITEQADGSLSIAHVEPGVSNGVSNVSPSDPKFLLTLETNSVRVQDSIQRTDGSIAGQKCRVTFGPYQYYQVKPGAPITSTANVGYIQDFAANAGMFGVRDNSSGTWTIVAQVGGNFWGAI